MPRIIRAEINHEILNWSREQAGLSIDAAAQKLRVPSERIIAWESGELSPTIRQLRLIGKAYGRPSAFFYLSTPPDPDPEIPDYRRTQRAMEEKPPQLIYEIRRARSRREIAVEVLKQLGEDPVPFSLILDSQDDPHFLGPQIREFLGIKTEDQFAWENPHEALRTWIDLFESKGIFVFQFSGIEVQVARGFSIVENPLPVIALNGKDSPRARIFTLLHEICHLAINKGGLCDLHEEPDEFASLEIFCNAVAAEAIVPREALLAQVELNQPQEDDDWSDQSLRALSNRFMVSREVVLRRLLDLGRTSRRFYEAKRVEFLDEYEQLSERGGGFIRYHKKILRNNGPAYTGLILDAYREHAISLMDVSRYLGNFRLNHLEQIEYELGQ